MNRFFLLCLSALMALGATSAKAEVSEDFVVLHCESPGTLTLSEEALTAPSLRITGNIDARDFNTLKHVTMFTTHTLDLSGAVIKEYVGKEGSGNLPGSSWMIGTTPDITYPANTLPAGAFSEWRNNSLYDFCCGSESLSRLILPSSLEGFMERALFSESFLTDLEVPAGSQTIRNEGHAVYSYDGTTLLCVAPAYYGDLVIPSTVTSVAPEAFECARPASVTFTSADMPQFPDKVSINTAYIIAPNPVPYQEKFPDIDCMASLDIISVENTQPGMLLTEIGNMGYTRKQVKAVKVTGPISIDDLKSLLQLSSLHYADLSEAEVNVEGCPSLLIDNPALTHIEFPVFSGRLHFYIDGTTRLHGDLTIPEGVSYFQSGSGRFTSVDFPSSVSVMPENYVFPEFSVIESIDMAKCKNLKRFYNPYMFGRLRTVRLPEDLQTLACYGPVKDINLPESLKELEGSQWFIDTLVLPKSLKSFSFFSLPLVKEIDAGSATSLERFSNLCNAPNLTRLDLRGCPVTDMRSVFGMVPVGSGVAVSGKSAYASAEVNHIQEVFLPSTLKNFNSFTNCPDLKRLDLMQCFRLETIYGFNNCPALEYLSLPESTVSLYGLLSTPKLAEIKCAAQKAPAYFTGNNWYDEPPLDFSKILLSVANGSAGSYRMAEGWELCKEINDGFVRVSISMDSLVQLGGNADNALVYGAGLYLPASEVTLRAADAAPFSLSGWNIGGEEIKENPCQITPDASVTACPLYRFNDTLFDIVIKVRADKHIAFPISIASFERTVYVDGEKSDELTASTWNDSKYSVDITPGEHTIALSGRDIRLTFIRADAQTEVSGDEAGQPYAVTSMLVHNPQSLSSLTMSGFDMETLDLSGCNSLYDLSGCNNRVSKLDISDCPALSWLIADNNKISALKTGNNPALEYISLRNNCLSSLDVSECENLEKLYVENNSLKSIELGHKPVMRFLLIYDNEIEGTLDISDCPALSWMDAANNKISALKTGNNPALVDISLRNNCLSSLDVSECENLEKLYVENNSLKSIELGHKPVMRILYFSNNDVEGPFDISEYPVLETLFIENNKISALIYDNHPNLKYLNIDYNCLPFLNIEDFPELQWGSCGGQQREMTISETNFNINLIKEEGLDLNRTNYWFIQWGTIGEDFNSIGATFEGDMVVLPEKAGRELTLGYSYLVNPAADMWETFRINIVREGFGSAASLMADSTVSVEGQSIVFAPGVSGEVYSISGVKMYSGTGETPSLMSGIYIVRVGTSTMKVMIP